MPVRKHFPQARTLAVAGWNADGFIAVHRVAVREQDPPDAF
jgi:hypothetical protein